jgi:hypothetical protein
MKKLMVILVGMAFLMMVMNGNASAQEIKFPDKSPGATVTQSIGLTEVTIKYHRPGVKNRTIWGDLVPYEKVWRTGANENTTITFGDDVKVEGKELKAGTYGLFTIPGKTEWTIIFSKQNKLWGAGGYKQEEDALRINVKPKTAPHCEWMAFKFTDITDGSAKAVLHWEKLMVPFTISFDTGGVVEKSIKRAMDQYWVPAYRSANYAYDKKMLDKAKQYIDMSVSLKKMYWNVILKAKIYKELAKTKKDHKNALKILEEAVGLGKELPASQQGYAKESVELLEAWKKKK